MLVSSLPSTITTPSEFSSPTDVITNHGTQNELPSDEENIKRTNTPRSVGIGMDTTVATTADKVVEGDEEEMLMEWCDHQEIANGNSFDTIRECSQDNSHEYRQQNQNQSAQRRQRCESMDVGSNNTWGKSLTSLSSSSSSTTTSSGLDEFDACAALTSLKGGVTERQPRRRSMSVNDATEWSSHQHNAPLSKGNNIDSVIGKAKKAASTLWLLLHAQVSSL
jgi:hypothetical protein